MGPVWRCRGPDILRSHGWMPAFSCVAAHDSGKPQVSRQRPLNVGLVQKTRKLSRATCVESISARQVSKISHLEGAQLCLAHSRTAHEASSKIVEGKHHEMLKPRLQTRHWSCRLSARLVQPAALLFTALP